MCFENGLELLENLMVLASRKKYHNKLLSRLEGLLAPLLHERPCNAQHMQLYNQMDITHPLMNNQVDDPPVSFHSHISMLKIESLHVSIGSNHLCLNSLVPLAMPHTVFLAPSIFFQFPKPTPQFVLFLQFNNKSIIMFGCFSNLQVSNTPPWPLLDLFQVRNVVFLLHVQLYWYFHECGHVLICVLQQKQR